MMTKLKYIIPTIIAVAIVIISTISIIQFINRKRYNPVKVLNEVKSYFMNVKVDISFMNHSFILKLINTV